MCAFHILLCWCCTTHIVACREKMSKKRTADKVKDFAFDDDTSDSEEENLGDFQAKVGLLKQDKRSKQSSPLKTGAGDSESDASEEDSDSSSEESEEEVVTKFDFKLSEEQKLKLSKLKSQLADIGGGSTSGSESDNDDDGQNVPIEANEEGSPDKEKEPQEGGESSEEDSDEDQEDSEDDDDQENDEPENNVQKSEEKTEETSQYSPAKKIKLDPDTITEESKEEKARKKYRDQLSKMSIEDIQKLKERLGLKLFQQKLEGTAPERGKKVFDWSSIFSGSSG